MLILCLLLSADVDTVLPPPAAATTSGSSGAPFVPQTLAQATGGMPSMMTPTAFGAGQVVPPAMNLSRGALPVTGGTTLPLGGMGPVVGAVPVMNAFAGLQPSIPKVASVAPAIDLQRIRQVAEEIARSGVAALQSAQNQPTARQTMPFLFAGNAGNTEFMTALKSAVDRNRLAKAAAFPMQAPPNAFGGPSAFR